MEDLIKRDDAIKVIEEIETERLRGQINLTYAPTIKRINDLPSADRPSGENLNSDYAECDQFVCSECGIHLQDWVMVDDDMNAYQYVFKFCPNCGCRVKGADDE